MNSVNPPLVNDLSSTPLALNAHTLPLIGRHLIEASAGTGKTFNITRIYLRMLLERRISVENILVMTFTKAATEEIRGRIDEFLRESLNHWQEYTADPSNEFFHHLGQMVEYKEARLLLKRALLNLDEAAIYTIHGFCKRVLSQQAFASGMNFNANMESDDSELLLQACQDHYRLLAKQDNIEEFQLLVEFWPTPDDFLVSFKPLLYQQKLPNITEPKHVLANIAEMARTGLQNLQLHQGCIFANLIDNKTGKSKQQRLSEFEQLRVDLESLQGIETNQALLTVLMNTPIDFKFISSARLPKSEDKHDIKTALLTAFIPIEQLKLTFKDFGNALRKSEVNTLVLDAVQAIKNSVNSAKSQLNMLNFDDLIIKLAEALKTDQNQPQKPLSDALKEQYPIALVDEFQDTDANQFDIIQALYFCSDHTYVNDECAQNTSHSFSTSGFSGNQHSNIVAPEPAEQHQQTLALYLIGDPKQAIYGFRGGDIFTYLKAGRLVDTQWMMDTNWRSSSQMINAYNHFFYGGALDKSGADIFGFNIGYQPVKASMIADNQQLCDDSQFKALQFIDFDHNEAHYSRGALSVDFRNNVADWCANEVQRLLQQSYVKNENSNIPTQAADIAILVRNGKEALLIKDALNRLNIASVYKSQRANLFASTAAQEFIHVLNAIINHEDDRAFIAALAGPYFGFSATALYNLQEDELQWEQVRSKFNGLRQIWQQRGFMAMALRLLHDHYPGCHDDAERQLTNIIHLFELLQSVSQRFKLPLELLAYLQEQCLHPNHNEAELRLESDANLIQIVTLHGSKGLEYPIVLVPFASHHKHPCKFGGRQKEVLVYHDEQGDLIHHVGENAHANKLMAAEGYAEDIRLLYVAITRAKHRCYLICGEFRDYHLSPVGKALNLSKGQSLESAVMPLIAQNEYSMGFCSVDTDHFTAIALANIATPLDTNTATFTGKIERDWWLSSFSALTRNIRHTGRTEPDRDEQSEATLLNPKDMIRFSFTKGAKTGNFLHDVFERTDFSQPNWLDVGTRYLTKFGELPNGYSANDVWAWFDDCLQAPLSKQGMPLQSLSWGQTLREAEFYFPMENVDLSRLKTLLNQFRESLVDKDKLSLINQQLPAYGELRGMMHGFIDLIFSHQDDKGNDKYYVSDYKSSYLGDKFSDYEVDKLNEHIIANFYDLQFLIYSLALHRYLARRVENYDFDCHFGGVYYLYLRGMSKQNTDFNGVFYQTLNKSLMAELDDIFKGVNTSSNKNAFESNANPVGVGVQDD